MERKNLTMLADFYELTMANGYFEHGMGEQIAYFDLFFRRIPEKGGFAIVAGLEQVVDYLQNLSFSEDDITYLRSKGIFSEAFLDYLRSFQFSCDVWAVPEGTPVFPGEPLITVRGPVIQSQFIETMLLLIINHQSLIATKSNRIVRAAKGRSVMEFGSRRAHGASAAVLGARAAYIGGCIGTACTLTDEEFGIPALGTMAHSWVQMFPTELEAFEKYADLYPDNCVFLVDTYNVLKTGVPNAIRVFKDKKPKKMGIRIDSGDITYLTRRARAMLDQAGLEDCAIVVSNSFDEDLVRDVIDQGACIDSFGVGERLITAKNEPVFGGVYKLSALEENGAIIPKIKISENVEKITNPGFKKVYRLFDKATDVPFADVITLEHEEIPEDTHYEIFNPQETWKRKRIYNFYAKELQIPIFEGGKLVYQCPAVQEIRKYCAGQVDSLWDEVKRFENPHEYYVDLSRPLWEMKTRLIEEHQS